MKKLLLLLLAFTLILANSNFEMQSQSTNSIQDSYISNYKVICEKYISKASENFTFTSSFLKDNDLYVLGSNQKSSTNTNIIFAKYFFSGKSCQLNWVKEYGGNGLDNATDFKYKDGFFYILASTNSVGAGNNDILVIKTDSTGNVIWQKTFGTSFDEITTRIYIFGNYLYVLASGSDSAGNYNFRILKLDLDGNIIWSKQWGNFYRAIPTALTIDQNQYIHIVGIAAELISGVPFVRGIYLILTDTGDYYKALKFTAGLIGQFNVAFTDIIREGNTFYVSGAFATSPADIDLIVLKLDNTQQVLKKLRLGKSKNETLAKIDFDLTGGIVGIGATNSESASYDGYIIFLDKELNVKSQHIITGIKDEGFIHLFKHSDFLFLSGATASPSLTISPATLSSLSLDISSPTVSLSVSNFSVTINYPNFSFQTISVNENQQNVSSLLIVLSNEIIIKSFEVSDYRLDVGKYVTIKAKAIWSANSTNAANIKLTLNQLEAFTDSNGIATFTEKSDEVKSITYSITSASKGLYQYTFKQEASSPTVIWDKIIIYEKGKSDDRLNVNDKVTVWFKLKYAYDNSELDGSKGTVFINNSKANWKNNRWELEYSSDKVGKFSFKVTSVSEVYELTVIEDNVGSVDVVFDRITILAKSENARINIGESYTIFFKLKSEYDNEMVKEGQVYINNILASFDPKNEYWYITYKSNNTIKIDFKITKLNWTKYNINVLNPNSDKNYTEVIWDQILMEYKTDLLRLQKGKEIKIYIFAKYEYDNLNLEKEAKIFINNTLANYDEEKKAFYITYSANEVKKVLFKATKAESSKYPINVFKETNVISVIFDEINYEVFYQETNENVKIFVKLTYSFDKSPVEGALIIVNNVKLNYEGNGIYSYVFPKINEFNIKISKEGFDDIIVTRKLQEITTLPTTTSPTVTNTTTITITTPVTTTVTTTQTEAPPKTTTQPSENGFRNLLLIILLIAIIITSLLIIIFRKKIKPS